ncbi:TetR family transcriptional regulator [Tardiphaga sp.]|uniref:TetR family transcriptional regulator n=1 Tax=Tardiphaga sp. TaxID=1926292 RepID=UPI00352AE9D8
MSGQDRETEELGHLEAISAKSKQKSRESRSTESADRRKAILNSARRVLIEQGYADFTMRGIARHAQIHLKGSVAKIGGSQR